MANRRRSCCGAAPAYNFCVTGCGGTPAGIAVQVLSGSTLIGGCTTGANGCCSASIPNGSYTVNANAGATQIYSLPLTLSAPRTVTMPANKTSNFTCCSTFVIPNTLTLTDSTGSIAFVNSGSGWTANTYPNNTGWLLDPVKCTFSGPSPGTIWVSYVMKCQSAAPWLLLTRTWAAVTNDGQVTYQYGLATTNSGFNGCGGGLSCAPTFQIPCQTSTDRQNPASGGPFSITFNPSPTAGNKTSDPVGGSVAISA